MKGEPQRSSSVICPIKDNFFNFENFVIGNDLSGKAWEHLLLGLSSTSSQPFSPKISYQLVNYLYCVDECSLASGFGEDLAARNIQRGRDHGIPGKLNILRLTFGLRTNRVNLPRIFIQFKYLYSFYILNINLYIIQRYTLDFNYICLLHDKM